MKRFLCILNVLSMMNFLIVVIAEALMREPWFTYLFTCVGSLFLCISVIGYRKNPMKNLCAVLLIVAFVLGVVFTIFHYLRGVENTVVVLLTVVLSIITNIGVVLINISSNSDSLYFKISHYSHLLLFILIAITFLKSTISVHYNDWIGDECLIYNDEPLILVTAKALCSCAFILSGLVFLFKNKIIKISISVLSWLFAILPIIYIIRGYWGFSAETISGLCMTSVIVMLICSIVASVKEWNKNNYIKKGELK